MASKHMKRCSTSLVIRRMQIKTTVRYHFILIKMAITKKEDNNKSQQGCGEIETLIHCWQGYKTVRPLWKPV